MHCKYKIGIDMQKWQLCKEENVDTPNAATERN